MAGVRAYALDPDHAKALWAKSEEMVGERFLGPELLTVVAKKSAGPL
jgi:hypothetical protein